jgi:hypothetical protein
VNSYTPPRRLPVPSWPVWVAFALLIIPGTVALGLLGATKDSSRELLAAQEDAVGRNIVLTGTLVDVETTSGLPKSTGQYEVTVPPSSKQAEQTLTASGNENWGFPPSKDHPHKLSFLVVLDDPPRIVRHGPVGAIHGVTENDVRQAKTVSAVTHGLWVAAIALFWMFALGLPVLGTTLAVRRRRAKKSLQHM